MFVTLPGVELQMDGVAIASLRSCVGAGEVLSLAGDTVLELCFRPRDYAEAWVEMAKELKGKLVIVKDGGKGIVIKEEGT